MDTASSELKFESDRLISEDSLTLVNITGKSLILIGDDRKSIHCLKSEANLNYCHSYSKASNLSGINVCVEGIEIINKLPEVKEGVLYIVDSKTFQFTLSTDRTVEDFLVVNDSDFNKEAGVYVCSKLKKVEYKYDFER